MFTEVQAVYKTAWEDLNRCLAKFNESLRDANLLIGIGNASLNYLITVRHQHDSA
jgi:hypothetical protein